MDGVFFVSGDAEALHHCRTARVLVATSRELATIQEAGVELDALVGSGEDEAELYHPGDLDPAAEGGGDDRRRPRRLAAARGPVPAGPAARRRSSTPTEPATASPRG